jgi:hypothetical protein
LVLSPTGSINLGFTTEGRLAAVLIIPSLGVPNWSVIYINTAPSTPPVTWQPVILRNRSWRGPKILMNVKGTPWNFLIGKCPEGLGNCNHLGSGFTITKRTSTKT